MASVDELANALKRTVSDLKSLGFSNSQIDAALRSQLSSDALPDLIVVLARYLGAYPAFRIKPTGAPGSPARIEQESLMALEDAAMAALAKARGQP